MEDVGQVLGPFGHSGPMRLPGWLLICGCGLARVVGRPEKPADSLCKDCRRRTLASSTGYYCWKSIIDRCTRPRSKDYPAYGGSGIGVCRRWAEGDGRRNGFQCFAMDMGPRPSPLHSVHRRDNTCGYEPENCEWATETTQQNARTNNRRLTRNDTTLTVSQWAAVLGCNPSVISTRLRLGWSEEKALSTPVRPKKKNPAGLS